MRTPRSLVCPITSQTSVDGFNRMTQNVQVSVGWEVWLGDWIMRWRGGWPGGGAGAGGGGAIQAARCLAPRSGPPLHVLPHSFRSRALALLSLALALGPRSHSHSHSHSLSDWHTRNPFPALASPRLASEPHSEPHQGQTARRRVRPLTASKFHPTPPSTLKKILTPDRYKDDNPGDHSPVATTPLPHTILDSLGSTPRDESPLLDGKEGRGTGADGKGVGGGEAPGGAAS